MVWQKMFFYKECISDAQPLLHEFAKERQRDRTFVFERGGIERIERRRHARRVASSVGQQIVCHFSGQP